MSGENYLVVIETQRVKDYLFASPKLRETRGASLLLDKLNRQDTRKAVDACQGKSIYLGGGSGRVLFDDPGKADKFCDEVRKIYRRGAISAQVSVERVTRQPNESFSKWMARGVAESQKNKLAKVEAVPLLAGRWIRPCAACGKAPAQQVEKVGPDEERYFCRACLFKHREVKKLYADVKRHNDVNKEELKKHYSGYILTSLVEEIGNKKGSDANLLLPQDFNQIAAQSKPGNYLGFIYADGNRMGETIKQMAELFPGDAEARQAYGAFSKIVDRSTREAAVEAVLECVPLPKASSHSEESRYSLPVEFILAGGDDLILVTPAHLALPVTARFIKIFQEKSLALQQQWQTDGKLQKYFAKNGLTTSAGVVIAHAGYPASQLMDLAGELMKLAKGKAADLARNRSCQGTLDFMVLHTPGSESAKQRRGEEYSRRTDALEVRLTERPYTVPDLEALLARIRALKEADVPRTKLKALYPILFEDLLPAQFEAQRIRERLRTTGALDAEDGPLQSLIEDLDVFPFRRDNPNRWTTPLSELIEIYDFVAPEVAMVMEDTIDDGVHVPA